MYKYVEYDIYLNGQDLVQCTCGHVHSDTDSEWHYYIITSKDQSPRELDIPILMHISVSRWDKLEKTFYLVRYCLSGIKVWHCSDILCRLHSVNSLNQLSVLNYTAYLDMITMYFDIDENIRNVLWIEECLGFWRVRQVFRVDKSLLQWWRC